MYIVEVTLKANPLALSVQRKEKTAADELYTTLLQALRSGSPQVMELTCERQLEKRLAVVTSEIMAVQISEKSASSGNLGTKAGFGLG